MEIMKAILSKVTEKINMSLSRGYIFSNFFPILTSWGSNIRCDVETVSHGEDSLPFTSLISFSGLI
jgi:hypothetical protein